VLYDTGTEQVSRLVLAWELQKRLKPVPPPGSTPGSEIFNTDQGFTAVAYTVLIFEARGIHPIFQPCNLDECVNLRKEETEVRAFCNCEINNARRRL
jgi:hypothetical protein